MPEQSVASVPLQPVKSFFVHMLTRDISLENALLDLVDNCVDGIQRIVSETNLEKPNPYSGYWAKIKFSKNKFSIEDNCGGIPWKYHEYAFRMGRPNVNVDKGLKTVGVYGIGMKRAIFKIGEDCVIETHSKDKRYKIHITPKWLKDDNSWELPPTFITSSKDYGTNITITSILSGIAKEFESDSFENALRSTIATHFSIIMAKGFRIYVNNQEVNPKSLKLLFADPKKSDTKIRPFIYKSKINGVDIFLTVGFTRPIPSSEEAEESLENFKDRYSSAQAGWSIICNDRMVLYCDKTALTGWGVSGVPQYHPQFTAISGMVTFTSTQPELLPTLTTKQGIDASSETFLHVRDKMIEGMKIFTQYTNQWKTKELVNKSKEIFKATEVIGIEEVKQKASKLSLKSARGPYGGHQYKPDLPRPEVSRTTERISFRRPISEIRTVSKHLFDTPDRNPSQVGEECFKLILKETA